MLPTAIPPHLPPNAVAALFVTFRGDGVCVDHISAFVTRCVDDLHYSDADRLLNWMPVTLTDSHMISA